MENMRFRCHFSIIFESLWQFWLVFVIILVQQAEVIIDVVRDVGTEGIKGLVQTGGIWVVAGILLFTLAILAFGFFRWRKTWITLEDNLIIFERNTLRKYKNTIAVENISAVNMERNLFERLVGTYKIKIDTGSMTTANKTDVMIVVKEEVAVNFRKAVLERMSRLKRKDGEQVQEAVSPETHPDRLFDEQAGGRQVFHSSTKDMLKHAFYTMPISSLLIAVAGIGAAVWYIGSFGFTSFIRDAVGGFIAVVLMVLSAIYSIIKRFITYYDFTVYRDGRDLHVRCGLLKQRSYTIPVDKITSVDIEQPLISRILKKYSVKVVTVGVGDEQGENSNITMSLSRGQLAERMSELLPEYGWGNIEDVKKEEKTGYTVRLAKSVKWHILAVIAVLVLYLVVELSLWKSIAIPVAADVFINLLYLLSHMTSGHSMAEEGLVLSQGYFRRVYTICTYKKMQVLTMNYHPAAIRRGIGNGVISLLNSATSVPYIGEEQAFEISKRIIRGGTK